MEEKNSRFNLDQYLSDSRRKTYFVTAVTLLFAIAVVIGGLLPAYSAVANQSKQNELRNEAIEKLQKKIGDLKFMIQEQEGSSELIDRLNYVFPDGSPQDKIVEEMEALSTVLGLNLYSITFSKSQRDLPIQAELQVAVQVSAEEVTVSLIGNRESLRNFVEQIERSRRIFNIRSLTMQRRQTNALAGSDYQMALQIEYFFWDINF